MSKRRASSRSVADEHGEIGFAEAMADRTVAVIVARPNAAPEDESLGSGVCIRYRDELFVLTAAHVVVGHRPEEIDLIARPRAPITRDPQRLVVSTRFHPPIVDVLESPGGESGPDDLALLHLAGRPREMEHVQFYPVNLDAPTPLIRRSVGIFGFPFESSRVLKQGAAVARAVMPYFDFPPVARMTRSSMRSLMLASYRPSRHVLFDFPDRPLRNPEGHLHDPRGLSGGAAWKVSPRSSGLWVPADAKPVAIVIGYNRRLGILAGTRIRRAWNLLREWEARRS